MLMSNFSDCVESWLEQVPLRMQKWIIDLALVEKKSIYSKANLGATG